MNEFPKEIITESDNEPLFIQFDVKEGQCFTPCPHKYGRDKGIMVGSLRCVACFGYAGAKRESNFIKCRKGMKL